MKVQPEPSEGNWAMMREAQAMALSLPNTGMACTIELGEADNIHPRNKQDVGHRLALVAEREVYGKDVVASGPVFSDFRIEGEQLRISFTETGSGLVSKGSDTLKGFAIAGEDKKFYWASARIEGTDIIVSSGKVKHPVAVRYAWANNPVCNLYNVEGLPAVPFRTDTWEPESIEKSPR
jgi:sialate O-acetylesterase